MTISVNIRKALRAGPRSFLLDARFESASKRVVIYGASGAGKSQMLKAIAGLSRPDSGVIELMGRSCSTAARESMCRRASGA